MRTGSFDVVQDLVRPGALEALDNSRNTTSRLRPELCVKRPVFAAVLVLVLLIFGSTGYLRLGVDRFPRVDIPFLTILTVLPGSAPEEVESEITDKIEEAVNTVSGIDELRSISSEGVSQIVIAFNIEKDIR